MRLQADIGHPVKDRKSERACNKPGAGDATHYAGHPAGPPGDDPDVSPRADGPQEAQAGGDAAPASPSEMKTRKLIAAAYRVSAEVGQELEAILKTGPSDENLASLHAKIVKATRNREIAERIYSAIFAALHPP